MLTAKKKISVREPIQESAFQNNWTSIQFTFNQYKKIILGVLLGIIGIAVVAIIYFSQQSAANEEASQFLATAIPLYEQQQYRLSIDGDRTRNVMGLKEIVDNYSSTGAGDVARLYLGNAYLALGEFDNAVNVLKEAHPSGDIIKAGILAGLGGAYEGKKDFLNAAEQFERSAKTFNDEVIAADRLIQAARNYSLANQKQKAKEILELVKNDYKATRFARDIDRYLAELAGE